MADREHESRSQLLAALSQRDMQFPLLPDADRAVAHDWFVRQTPTAFLIAALILPLIIAARISITGNLLPCD